MQDDQMVDEVGVHCPYNDRVKNVVHSLVGERNIHRTSIIRKKEIRTSNSFGM